MNITYRMGNIDDLNAIYEFLTTYLYVPKNYPAYKNKLTWNYERGLEMMRRYFDGCVILAWDNNILIGISVVQIAYSFYNENEADIEMFFIHPDYRKYKIARQMAKYTVELIEQNNVAVTYLTYNSGFGGKIEKMYQNLWKKYGFDHLGFNMIRS